ncbi:MAG: TatD family hydrolase, partial [Nitrospiraceae bacterium]
MNPTLIDTHCHLEMDAFEMDRYSVIDHAGKTGIENIISVGSDRKGCTEVLKICQNYPQVYGAVGIHPHDAKTLNDKLCLEIKNWLQEPKVIAVGEIGLDYHYMHSPKDTQRDTFKKQIRIAREAGLPVIVHSREAKNDTLNILQGEALDVPEKEPAEAIQNLRVEQRETPTGQKAQTDPKQRKADENRTPEYDVYISSQAHGI